MPLLMHGAGRKTLLKMIRFLMILLVGLISGQAFSQYNSEGDLISRFHPGSMWFYTGLRPAETEKVRKYDRLIFDVTYNDWIGEYGPFENKWSSIGLNTNLMFDVPLSKGNTLSFGWGLSHSIFSIHHDGTINSDMSDTYSVFYPDGAIDFKSRKLNGNSFSIPLELRFRTKGWKHFKFHMGGKIGYLANAFQKSVITDGGEKVIIKDHGINDLNKILYSAHIRIGMRNWALFGSYSINSLFKSSESTKFNLIQAGLSISLY
jgi:hypothetical protein